MGDVEEAGGADRSAVAAVIDGELDPFGLALGALLDVLLPPTSPGSAGSRCPSGPGRAGPRAGSSNGRRWRRDRVQRAQCDDLADDDEVWLVAIHPGIV